MALTFEPVTITLEGKQFAIRPLTLRQVRDIELYTAQGITSNVEHIAGILEILLKREHADELPPGGVLDMEITKDEIGAAAEAITRLTGGDSRAGEAQAAQPVAADPEKTGDIASAA
jgi:hypothetical protein